jgi:hypothetical protein
MKLDLLTNATVIEDAIRFVTSSESRKSKCKTKLSSDNSKDNGDESKEPDYDEKSDKEGEEKQEKETEEIAITTANQVF